MPPFELSKQGCQTMVAILTSEGRDAAIKSGWTTVALSAWLEPQLGIHNGEINPSNSPCAVFGDGCRGCNLKSTQVDMDLPHTHAVDNEPWW